MPRLALLVLVATLSTPLAAQQQLAPLPQALPLTHPSVPTVPQITAADLKTRLYIFADDSMQGREAATLGNYKATNYIAAEVQKLGLTPAGDSNTYFQTIPTILRTISPKSTLTVDTKPYTVWTDFAPIDHLGVQSPSVQVIYAGHAGVPYQLTPDQTKGKLVVFTPPTLETLQNDPQAANRYPPQADNAVAIAYIALDRVSPTRITILKRPQLTFQSQPEANRDTQGLLFISPTLGQALFTQPITQLTPGTLGKTISLNYTFDQNPTPYPARNVVAILRGSDPILRNTYVAIGAHNDHLGYNHTPVDHDSLRAFNHFALISGADSPHLPPTALEAQEITTTLTQLRQTDPPRQDSIYNGADDDGSGTVSVLEIAQQLAALPIKPKRSILFVWHTGEEKGLWGSTWFTDHPTVPRDSIITQLNIDMIGRGDASDIVGGNPNYLQLVGSRRLSTQLGDLIEKINTQDHHDLQFDYAFDANGHPEQIYCRSDHYSYARYGIPVTFFTTGLHPDYHQVTDEPEYIDYDHMARVAAFISDVALHVANMPQRPVVDHPKPDPHGMCRQ